MYKSRLLTGRLKKLTGAFPAVVVSGARQVGKSTLIKHVFGQTADIVVFDPVQDIENARQDPELFLKPPLPEKFENSVPSCPQNPTCITGGLRTERRSIFFWN